MSAIPPIVSAALVLGSIYALIASGLSFVWGTVRIFNFAQGALLTLGAYIAFYAAGWATIGGALAVSVVVLAVAGLLLYITIAKPFVGRPDAELMVILTTIAAATFIEDGVDKLAGPDYKALPHLAQGTIRLFNTAVSYHEAIIIFIGPGLLLALAVLLKRTKVGMAIRAVAQNHDGACLAGINVRRIYAVVFGISAVLAAVAGVLYGGEYSLLPTMGDTPLLKAFIVVVVGGLGSLPGTIAGAYVVALVEAIGNYYVGLFWTPPILFGILIAIMLVRPRGLLGVE